MMVKSSLEFLYFEIQQAPSEIPANLPGQFSLSGHIFLHWAAAIVKGLIEFKKKSRPLLTIIFNIASDSQANITTSCETEFFNFLWLI